MAKKATSQAIVAPYEPISKEAAAQTQYDRNWPAAPSIKVTMSVPDESGQRTANVVLQISDPEAFNASIGGESEAFTKGMLDSVCCLANEVDVVAEKQANFALSIVQGLNPRDQVEGLLCAQIAAIHIATMRTAAKLGRAKSRDIADQYERALNRLTRTFAAQLEALKRYRSKGEQRVYVERVTVNEGGQAVVEVVGRGRQREKRTSQSLGPCQRRASVLGQVQAICNAVSVPCCSRPTCVSNAWRQSRGAEGEKQWSL